MDDEAIMQSLNEAIDQLWAEGCPAATPTRRAEVIKIGLRRWRSFDRRTKRKHPIREERIADLAKGLRDALEPEPKVVGPSMVHYYCLARAMAHVLEQT